MQKTKLGLPINFLGALVFFFGLFAGSGPLLNFGNLGVLPLFLLAGYILLSEQDEWLRNCAIKAVTIVIFFQVLILALGLISGSGLLGWIEDLVRMFDSGSSINLTGRWFCRFIGFIQATLALTRTIALVAFGIMSFLQISLGVKVTKS